VCLDPRDLNQAFKREHYPLPTLEELTLMLSDAKYSSVLDATKGFWQIKIARKALLTTFKTPLGRYRFARLPFGIHSAEEVFQKPWTWHFKALVGAFPLLMICLSVSSKEEHDQNLRKIPECTRGVGIMWNAAKCVFGAIAKEMSYFEWSCTI